MSYTLVRRRTLAAPALPLSLSEKTCLGLHCHSVRPLRVIKPEVKLNLSIKKKKTLTTTHSVRRGGGFLILPCFSLFFYLKKMNRGHCLSELFELFGSCRIIRFSTLALLGAALYVSINAMLTCVCVCVCGARLLWPYVNLRLEGPQMLDYAVQAKGGSMLNTPPTWAIYMASLVFDWIVAEGGLDEFAKR